MISARYWFTMLTYVLMHLSGFVTIPLLVIGLNLNPIDALVYGQLAAFALATIISLYLLRTDIVNELKHSRSGLGKIIQWTVIGMFLAYFAQMIAALIELNIFAIDPVSENTAEIMNVIDQAPIFLIIPAVFAPILEELIFRKIIFGTLHTKMNFFWAAILSSLGFAVIHLDLTHLLVYTGMGLVFSYLYVKTKTIIVPILVHMGMNSITVLAQLLIDVDELERLQNELSSIIYLIGG